MIVKSFHCKCLIKNHFCNTKIREHKFKKSTKRRSNSGVKTHFADLENPAEFKVIENLVKKEKAAGESLNSFKNAERISVVWIC